MGLTRMPAWSGRYLPFGAGSMTVAPVRVLRSGRVVKARRGMGSDLRVDPTTGQTIDCSSFSGLFNGTCWGILTTKGQQSYIYGNTPILSTANPPMPLPPAPPAPVATPSNPNPLVTPPVDQQSAQQTVDATIAAQGQAWQAQNQQFFADLDSAISANQQAGGQCSQNILSGVCDWIVLAAGAGLVLGVAYLSGGGRR